MSDSLALALSANERADYLRATSRELVDTAKSLVSASLELTRARWTVLNTRR